MQEYNMNDVITRLNELKCNVEDKTDVYIIEDLIFLMETHWGSVDVSVIVDIMEESFLD